MTPAHKRLLLIALQLAVLAGFAWAIEHWWGFGRLLVPWAAVPAALIALVVAAQLASYGLRALRIYLAEASIPRHAYPQALRLILLNNALNLLLPARTGEASFPLLMQRWFGVPLAQGAGTLLWLRLLDLNILATLAALTLLPALLSRVDALEQSLWFTRPLALACAGLPLLAPLLARRALHRLGDAATGWRARARQAVLGVPHTFAAVWRDLGLTWAAWLIKLAGLTAVYALLAKLHPATALLGVIGGDLSTVLPLHTPGGFGTYEAGVIAFASPLAAPTPALLAAAVNLHVLVLGIALAAGGVAWLAGMRKSAP